jgi:hypothetical protein
MPCPSFGVCGFALRSGSGGATVSADLILFFHILWNCGIGSSALVALTRGQGLFFGYLPPLGPIQAFEA